MEGLGIGVAGSGIRVEGLGITVAFLEVRD